MKKKFGMAASLVLMILSVLWILSLLPFNQEISREIPVKIYESGIAVKDTTVYIEGSKSNPLFGKPDSFSGKFHILSYEKTAKEDMNASIRWEHDTNVQKILYISSGSFPDMDIMYFMLISEDMTKFALMFNDGTILATSEELYELYARHFSVTGPDSMSIVDVEGIPKIK